MTSVTCVNLMERFGRRYKIGFDPAYNAKGRHRAKLDPWMMLILCQRGTIHPHGGDTLAVEIDGRPIIARRLQESGVCRLYQDGDREKTFLFDVADFQTVAKIIKPRRRHRLTEEQKAAVRERLRKFQFRTSERQSEPVTPASVAT